MGSAGGPSNIQIYLRMRPISGTPAAYEVDPDEGRVQWHVPRHLSLGMVNHQKERYDFLFNHIFDVDGKQEDVFAKVAQKVVLGALDGYNGTIFAYGQTGSGKTFTITGGAERYVDRGIIPRAISLIYSELGRRSDYTYTIHFSYLEIYNETGIDLLNPDHETKSLEELPKVVLLEDDENVIHMRNLSSHLATNEEEALNLLFLGDTNRMISSTPMNMASSRSHCIFTANIEARKAGEDTVCKSKLHLVDLAGSERVSKTGVDGQILREAKYINLSLHFLEQVIVALQERSQGKARNHIPYRNSMMTSVLRDSIGGNCQTVMIATVSIAQDQLEETISTCRFAQRVATISNEVLLNEEIDPNLVIKRLKQEVKDLKAELQLLRGDAEDDHPLTENELKSLQQHVQNYIDDTSCDAVLNVGVSVQRIKAIFQIFKGMIKEISTGHPQSATDEEAKETLAVNESIRDLNRQIQERDNEINMLISFIKKKDLMGVQSNQCEGREIISKMKNPLMIASAEDANVHSMDPILSKKEAFEEFKRTSPGRNAIEENKCLLRAKYQIAKGISNEVNGARERIETLKSQIQKRRIEHAMKGLTGTVASQDSAKEPSEDHIIAQIEAEKRKYKEGFNQLRDLKSEIENIQNCMKRSQMKLEEDFERWFGLINKIHDATSGSSMTDPHPEIDNPSFSRAVLEPCSSSRIWNNSPYDQRHYIQTAAEEEAGSHRDNIQVHHGVKSFGIKGKTALGQTTHSTKKQDVCVPVTGNAKADADIAAFYEARDKILKLKEKQTLL